jgi:DNA-directed RNA polymerase specialized sigma24 family protein
MNLDNVVADLGSDPRALLERSGEIAAVRRVLAAAREPDRVVLSLKYPAEWRDEALGALLGISTGALRKRLFDARQRLRPGLAEDLGRPASSKSKRSTA